MKELLIPVGNYECLVSAVHAGADAVYAGGIKFGARAFANNFTESELESAVKYCHLYGVKIYITVNTIIYESEIEEVIDYVTFLHKIGVDAVIVQDIGLIKLIRETLPNLEVHASTQCNNTNQETINELESLGVTRIVYARELSIDEIDKIEPKTEKEAFIHGALCVSYSGECLFSSIVMGRSGNRGECAGMCRLPYKIMRNEEIISTNGAYLLSPRELNTASNFKRIMESSIYSLKIEGRMKSSAYVACVTKMYKDLISKYNNHLPLEVDPQLAADLKYIFNREYTSGFLFNSSFKDFMNIKTPNHQGEYLGDVIEISNKYIKIKLAADLNQEDGIRFNETGDGMICNFIYNEKLKLIAGAKKGDYIYVDNKFNLKNNTSVNKTLDINIMKKYNELNKKYIPVMVTINANLNEKLYMKITDSENEVEAYSDNIIEQSINSPTSSKDIIKNFGKLLDTAFSVKDININISNNIFVPVKTIKNLRRSLIQELTNIRENKKKEFIIKPRQNKFVEEEEQNINISVLVNNENQLREVQRLNVDRIYIRDYSLFKKYENIDNIYYKGSKVIYEKVPKILANNLGAINNSNVIIDYGINAVNHYAIDYLFDRCQFITLSPEISDEELVNIMLYHKYQKLEFIIYGTPELMTMKYCPINHLINKDEHCHACLDSNYYLLDRNDKKYPIITDIKNHLTTILNYKPIVKINNYDFYKQIGIKNFRIDLYNEDICQIREIINQLR